MPAARARSWCVQRVCVNDDTDQSRSRDMSLVKLALLLLVATVGASYETSAVTSGRSARCSATHAPLVSRGSLSAPRQTLLRLRGGVRELGSREWGAYEEVGDKLLVVDFTAVWCGPCQRIAPAFAALAEEYADSAHFVKVDVDKLGELAAQLGVTSMPTFSSCATARSWTA